MNNVIISTEKIRTSKTVIVQCGKKEAKPKCWNTIY